MDPAGRRTKKRNFAHSDVDPIDTPDDDYASQLPATVYEHHRGLHPCLWACGGNLADQIGQFLVPAGLRDGERIKLDA